MEAGRREDRTSIPMAPTLPERCSHTAIALLLLVASACARPSKDETPFEAAQQALRRGALDEALSHVDRGSRGVGCGSETPAVHQLRLLRAEILLAKPDIPAAAALVDLPIPDAPEFAQLRARQRYVRARIEVARGQLEQALATLESHRGPIRAQAESVSTPRCWPARRFSGSAAWTKPRRGSSRLSTRPNVEAINTGRLGAEQPGNAFRQPAAVRPSAAMVHTRPCR